MESPLARLPSSELLERLGAIVRRDRANEAELLLHLGEVDTRRLYREQACSSMFDSCVRVLRFAEGVAYKRIQVARAARRHPELLDAIRRGDLNVTAANLLGPHLTRQNACELIEASRHRTVAEVRALLADRTPRPDVQTSVRTVRTVRRLDVTSEKPERAPVETLVPVDSERRTARYEPPASAPVRPEPLGGQRYCVRFTAGPDTWAELQELRALMRHQVPDGDLGKILSRAISVLRARVRKQKIGECSRPSPSMASALEGSSPSRAIPAAVRREVFQRDEGHCTFVSAEGRRCGAREFLELHHLRPWASSRSHRVDGIALRCRAHNQYAAERDFGERHMARLRSEGSGGNGI